MSRPKASRPQSRMSSPSGSPPLATERSRWPKRRGNGTCRIILSAVGGRNAFLTPCRAINERFLGVELACAMREHRDAEIKAGQQHIEEPADPRPIGWGPVTIARRREELVRQLYPRDVAEQHSRGV